MSAARESSIHNPRYQRLIRGLTQSRNKAQLSQGELAGMMGLSQPDISKIEACERRIDLLEALDWLNACQPGNAAEAIAILVKEAYAASKH
jgi:predicted transcriptional regulator